MKKMGVAIMLLGLFALGITFGIRNLSNHLAMARNEIIINEKVASGGLAIMVEQEDGSYKRETEFPSGYELDHAECENGVNPEFNYDGTKLSSSKIKQSTYCHLYFKINSCASIEDVDDILRCDPDIPDDKRGDLQRFVGDDPSNYICFGTNSKSTCISNPTKYMFRIIGFASDGSMKLLRNSSLGFYDWYYSHTTDCNWLCTSIRSEINGSGFYNTLSSTWQNKILDTGWHYGETTSLYHVSGNTAWNIEKNWPTSSSKVGLMYVSDFLFSYPSGSEEAVLSSSWIYRGPNTAEWLLDHFGRNTSSSTPEYNHYGIERGITAGRLNSNTELGYGVGVGIDIRPTFFVKSGAVLSGNGTLSDPYIITN